MIYGLFPYHFQAGDVSSHSTIDKTLNEMGDNSSEKKIFESPSSIPNGSLEIKAARKKPMKKHLKRQLRNMHIGIKLKIFRASLHMHSKKKHKKSKKCTLKAHVLLKDNLLDKDCFPSDLGSSTSEKFSTISLGLIHHRRKKVAYKNVNNNSSSLMSNINGEVKERIYQNGTVLASDQQAERSSGSVLEAHWHNSREIDSLKDGKTGSSPYRHVFTKGLGEIAGAYLLKITIFISFFCLVLLKFISHVHHLHIFFVMLPVHSCYSLACFACCSCEMG